MCNFFKGNEYLYWLDSDKGRISRIKRDGTAKEVVLSGLDSDCSGLVVDWNAGNINIIEFKLKVTL